MTSGMQRNHLQFQKALLHSISVLIGVAGKVTLKYSFSQWFAELCMLCHGKCCNRVWGLVLWKQNLRWGSCTSDMVRGALKGDLGGSERYWVQGEGRTASFWAQGWRRALEQEISMMFMKGAGLFASKISHSLTCPPVPLAFLVWPSRYFQNTCLPGGRVTLGKRLICIIDSLTADEGLTV